MTDDTTDADTGGSGGSRLRTLLLLGFSFLAGYLAGRGQRADVEFAADLEAVPPGEAEPMEIEIEGSGTGGGASVEGSETEESETAAVEEADESAEESTETEGETESEAAEEGESDGAEDES